MGQQTWTVQFEDGLHTIELEHGYWSGKRRIMVDGNLVHQGGGWIKVWAVGARTNRPASSAAAEPQREVGR